MKFSIRFRVFLMKTLTLTVCISIGLERLYDKIAVTLPQYCRFTLYNTNA